MDHINNNINDLVEGINNINLTTNTIGNNNLNIDSDIDDINNLFLTDINYFNTICSRNENDKINKIREKIINCLINKTIKKEWLKNAKWNSLKLSIDDFITQLLQKTNISKIEKINCKQAGGRNKNYDLDLTINNKHIKLEFKFNAKSIEDCPQFSSPMKPSQYMSNNFEEYFYDNYLPKIIEKYNDLYDEKQNLINKEEYLKSIHQPKPPCVLNMQKKYYGGSSKTSSQYTGNDKDIEFCQFCKKINKEAIKKFIDKTSIKIEYLSSYLKNTQKDKYYMLFKNNQFYLQEIPISLFEFDDNSLLKTHNTFKIKNLNNNEIKILLRWKNGNGIAFPAFQIK